MKSTVPTIKTNSLQARYASLSHDYAVAHNQWQGSIDNVERSRLSKKMEQLHEEIREIDRQLAEIESTEASAQQDWRSHLPLINFKEAVTITEELLLTGTGNSAALFLVPSSLAMGGELCVVRIRDLLQEKTGDFSSIQLKWTSAHQLSEKWILENLAHHLNVQDLPEDPRDAARKIIKTLRQSIRSGSIRFIEIRGWEFIPVFSEVLTWFVKELWIPLTRELMEIETQYRRVRFVIIVIANEPLRKGALPDALLCSRSNFNVEKVLEIPLQNWSKQEIVDWLELYAKLSSEEIINLSRKIYRSSKSGLPSLVHDALAQHF